MSGQRIVVVGDVINDLLVVPRTEIRRDTDTTSTIRSRPGGSAANTAAWLGSLGAAVDFVGCVGSADAEYHAEALRHNGVNPELQIEPGLQTGTIVIIIEAEQRSMLVERGANSALRQSSVTDELLAEAAILVLSGYSVLDGLSTRGTRQLIDRANAAGLPIAVTLGSMGYLADFGPKSFLAAIEGIELAFLNYDEGRLLTDETDVDRIAAGLKKLFAKAVMTIGSDGVVVVERGKRAVKVPAPVTRLVDPTGAGDAFAAGFLERWVAGDPMVASAEAGVYVAARAVMLMGGRPPV